MRSRNVIAYAKKSHNLFVLNMAMPGLVMSAKAMVTSRRDQPTHLVSRNKRVRPWHYRLTHTSNVHVIRVSKLSDGIKLKLVRKYDPTEVFVDLKNSNDSANNNQQINQDPDIFVNFAC